MDSFEHYRRFVNLTLLVKRNPFQSIKEFYRWSHPLCVKDDSSSAFLQLKNSNSQLKNSNSQEGMITWCWLAEHACIKLVSRFKRILKKNFRNASLLSLTLTRSFHLNVKENQHTTKLSLLVEKQNDFSDQKRIDSQPENSLSGDGWCWTKH